MSQINENVKTPGAYVNEIPSFPPSVAQVATAIPAFIGYTETAIVNGKDVTNQAVRISSLVEYVQYFGTGPDLSAEISLNADNSVKQVDITPSYKLFNAIRLFFNHGGSNCYIISVGGYSASGAVITDFIADGQIRCFEVLEKQDEPTLIVVPDAVMLDDPNDFYNIMTKALNQCAELQDRFTIMDIWKGFLDRKNELSYDVIQEFRNGIGASNLNYGAAYYPWLRSSLSYSIPYKNIDFKDAASSIIALNKIIINNPFLTQLDNAVEDRKTPAAFFTNRIISFAGGVSEVDATCTIQILTAGDPTTFKLMATGVTNSIGSYNSVASDTPATIAGKLALAINALSGTTHYTATSKDDTVTVAFHVVTGSNPGTLSCAPALVTTGGTVGTVSIAPSFTPGVVEVLATGTATIMDNVAAGSTVTLFADAVLIASFTATSNATPNQVAAGLLTNLPASAYSISSVANTAVVTVKAAAGTGAGANAVALSGTITGDSVSAESFFDSLGTVMPPVSDKATLGTVLSGIGEMLIDLIGFNPIADTIPAKAGNATVKSIHDKYIMASSATATSFTPIEILIRELLLLNSSYPDSPPASGDFSIDDFTARGYLSGKIGQTADASIYGTSATAYVTNISARVLTLYNNVVNYILNFRNEIDNLISNLELQLIASSAVYANITQAIKNEGIIVPPSGAVAGVYASVDATRGVWKAPANVSLNTVIEPMVTINDNMQDDLNVDVNAGKSINAIRAFTGKGILVWGARTLEGNSNDWRYISVRRFYIMVEETVKKAAFQFVFEPNDGKTWVRLRAMIENYLSNLWSQGALAGAKPEAAYYVKVGLGQTMTFQDVLDGKMIVEIGMAPVRPAEFIILRFSQVQQQA